MQSVPLNPCGSLPGNRQEQVAPISQMGRLWLMESSLPRALELVRTRWSPRPDGALLSTRSLSLASRVAPASGGNSGGLALGPSAGSGVLFTPRLHPKALGGPISFPGPHLPCLKNGGHAFYLFCKENRDFLVSKSCGPGGSPCPLPDKGLPSTHGRRS